MDSNNSCLPTGIDSDRVISSENLPKEYFCPICFNLVHPSDAFQVEECEHLFCGPCIKKATEVHGQCPQCQRPIGLRQLKPVQPFVFRLLGQCKVKCARFQDGCNWVGEVFDANLHEKQCGKKLCSTCHEIMVTEDKLTADEVCRHCKVLLNLLVDGKTNEAFTMALSHRDLSKILMLFSKMELTMSYSDSLSRLSPAMQFSLFHRLSCDFGSNSEVQLRWLHRIMATLNSLDSQTAAPFGHIYDLVSENLVRQQRNVNNSSDLRPIINFVNTFSLLTRCSNILSGF